MAENKTGPLVQKTGFFLFIHRIFVYLINLGSSLICGYNNLAHAAFLQKIFKEPSSYPKIALEHLQKESNKYSCPFPLLIGQQKQHMDFISLSLTTPEIIQSFDPS